MHSDASRTTPAKSLASRIGPQLKRAYAQAATAAKEVPQTSRNVKLPRLGHSPPSLGFSSERSSSQVSLPFSAEFPEKMPHRSSGRAGSSSRGSAGVSGGRNAPKNSRGGPAHVASRARGAIKQPQQTQLSGPLHDKAFIDEFLKTVVIPAKEWQTNPNSALSNWMISRTQNKLKYVAQEGVYNGKRLWRSTVRVLDDLVGQGDAENKKESEQLAGYSALGQIAQRGLFTKSPDVTSQSVQLSDGSNVSHERARQFMDYYCRRYGFGKPDITLEEVRGNPPKWEAVMTVGGRRIGLGCGANKKNATISCYLDVAQYLESCDRELWKTFVAAARTGKDLGLAPKLIFQVSEQLEDDIRDLCSDVKRSTLFRNRPAIGSSLTGSGPAPRETVEQTGYRAPTRPGSKLSDEFLAAKSKRLLERRKLYLSDPSHEGMRGTRSALPVFNRASDILQHINENDVTICMAATGSGKTTQIPQLILDSWIDSGNGAQCNIICTQPRRIAAISVANRVANERGEVVGRGSIGFHVRFEHKFPEEHGSVTFCTTGVFLKRMHSALQEGGPKNMDDITHIVVDEVHERDIDTDLLLVVLKRLSADRKAKRKPLKVVLMSATIDPTLFQRYFPDEAGNPAKCIDIPGRSYPVDKYFLEDFIQDIAVMGDPNRAQWVFADEKVARYLVRELGSMMVSKFVPLNSVNLAQRKPIAVGPDNKEDELEIPYPLVALTISYVLTKSESGHVLVFLPGWEEIQSVQRILLDSSCPTGLHFSDPTKYSLHVLHSTIPLAEQQLIFEPAPPGVRRIILATNIAETSVTIPDVVYVVDTAKIKENQYDPERHMSSLVQAWVGSSNLNQRAGRAGRHRPGEYYGLLSKQRANGLQTHQTVEMNRSDLSNVVMHVKALDFPNMEVEDVLSATIEPPDAERIHAAMSALAMVGALDSKRNLTSLGRVLLQIPVDVQMGRLVLFGSFFRCLDQALTLAAILSNRDPFLNPPLQKKEAALVKDSWTPIDFRSDALAVLRAYNAWSELVSRGDHRGGDRFLHDNFLFRPTMLMISKVRVQLLQSLYSAGVIDVSAGGGVANPSYREGTVPPQLNLNGESLPLLAALISVASQPKFAIRTSSMTYRTAQDKTAAIHPSSVNHRKREHAEIEPTQGERQIVAFSEKRRNLSQIGSAPGQLYLVGCTRLDPLSYMLFGAYNIQVTESGLECDEWLPIVGNLDALDNTQRLKVLMEACMLRVFEGINMSRRRGYRERQNIPMTARARDVEKDESDDEDEDFNLPKDLTLSPSEIKDLDLLTRDIVRILDKYNQERISSQSRRNSRPATPVPSPFLGPSRLKSGNSTPYRLSYDSRPSTPSSLRP
ncbi:P-loop containing nucleoside triphosphate hydrolase protein [Rickenella mellea]|uniref:P-loop containing nucleoside triphosphate hydrolase protein n=1 Tax=Rickenella mellea TaxID=50990 RepID=A0A4Y7QLB0_9AGAM|nr:P-loop containing nucleoside triphosphate hydrolase protein [Rickenella mellea]